MPDFSSYLESVRRHYEQWWSLYTLTDAEGRSKVKAKVFDFGLMVQTIAPKSERMDDDRFNTKEQVERFTVLDGLRKYAGEHVLLIGRPGSGKSTALARLLLEEAEKEDRIPILVELRYWNESGVLGLIQSFLRSLPTQVGLMPMEVDRTTLEGLLRSNKFLLLIDGLNELPSEAARQDVLRFRREFPRVAIVFTTRDLSLGGDFGIEKRLEMQPLTEAQMKEFVTAYIPEQSEAMLRQLDGRLREFGSTPLLLWMLCELFRQTGEIPTNLGGVFRAFTTGYERSLKADVVLECDRRWWTGLLQELAARMMIGDGSVEFGRVIDRTEVETIFTAFLRDREALAAGAARRGLEDLLRHHLIQANGSQVEFRHQLIQEYYAAEWLLVRVGGLDDATVQQEFLNYLKWTEPVALMLALVESEALAVRVVTQALDVDLMLGARLAGEVRSAFQERTVGLVSAREVREWFKIFLLGKTKSRKAVDKLTKIIKNPDPIIRRRAVWASRELNREFVIAIINEAIKDPDSQVRETAMRVVAEVDIDWAVSMVEETIAKELVASVREIAVICILGKSNSDASILLLIKATQDRENNVSVMADYNLKNIRLDILLTSLSKALDSKTIDTHTRKVIIEKIGEIGDESVLCDLFKAQLDLNINIHHEASRSIRKIRERLIKRSDDLEDYRKQHIQRQIDDWFVQLKSESPIPRGNAVLGLKNLPDKKIATEIMFQALEDPHHYVRGHAVHGIAELIGKEAVFELMRALDDQHCDVRGQASQELANLRKSLPDGLQISEDTVFKLIDVLEEEKNTYIRSKTLQTLKDLCSIFIHLSLNKKLEDAFLRNSDDSDQFLRINVAQGLGIFHSNKVITKLFQMLKDVDLTVALAASGSLKNMPLDSVVKYLSNLLEVVLSSEEGFALDAILDIQSNCKFYNYEIQQAKLRKADRTSLEGDRSLTIVYGDYIVGDKIQGDKIKGDKYAIDRLGNLNTGPVNIHGNQNGEQ